MLWLMLALGCSQESAPVAPVAPAPEASHPLPPLAPGDPGRPGGPPPQGSGGEVQDPTGFPVFHKWPPPQGPEIPAGGAWSTPVQLTADPGGGYRPQIEAADDGTLHVVYYERTPDGDLIRHRTSSDGIHWSEPAHVGFDTGRNWGPDIVARDDGSVVLVFDHSDGHLTSRAWLTTWRGGRWAEPRPLTSEDGDEVGSVHVADGPGDDLAVVWIGKPVGLTHHFRAWWRWEHDGTWSDATPLSDGTADAWHTNVERRPDGSVLVGYDVGRGGTATRLFVAEGRSGSFGDPEDLTATGEPGERPHFAFGPDGRDHVTWFHKENQRPLYVYTRSGHPGAWGPVEEPSRGYGGYHFDPEIAVNARGWRCLVWGWDAGSTAELVYSLDKGEGWSPPRRVAGIGAGKPGLPSLVGGPGGDFHVVWNQGVAGHSQVYYSRLGGD